jgi:cystathionine beta-synthase
VLCDWGEHYLSKAFDDEWMKENGFLARTKHRSVREMLRAKPDDVGVIAVEPSTSVRVALGTITTHDIGQLPVLRDGECVGSLAESDLMARVIAEPGLLEEPVESVVDVHVDAEEVTRLLQRGNAACLVRENGTLGGIVTRYDLVRALTGAAF